MNNTPLVEKYNVTYKTISLIFITSDVLGRSLIFGINFAID